MKPFIISLSGTGRGLIGCCWREQPNQCTIVRLFRIITTNPPIYEYMLMKMKRKNKNII
jgi:hypothetical protein